MIRIIAVLLNIALLCVFVYFCTSEGLPPKDAPLKEWIFFGLIILTPLFNLICLFRYNLYSWPALYLKRKALEEKKKIEQLQASKDK